MQLTRALALAATLAIPARTWADPPPDDAGTSDRRATASLTVYSDDDHMTVTTPRAGAQARASERVVIDVNATADIISGASIDVVSEASPSPIRETRLAAGFGATVALSRTVAGRARALVSHESDYRSLGVELGGAWDLARRNTTLDLELAARTDRVGNAMDPTMSEPRDGETITFTVTQALDPLTFVNVVVDGSRDHGFLESAYRTVPIYDPLSPDTMRVSEEVPDRRLSLAGLARVRRALTRHLFVHADYRYYADDWSIGSHTVSATLIAEPLDRVRIGAGGRYYRQSAADFYQARYDLVDGAAPDLRTRDRRLGRMSSETANVTVDLALTGARPEDGVRLSMSAVAMRFSWPDFPAQTRRSALALTLGAVSAF